MKTDTENWVMDVKEEREDSLLLGRMLYNDTANATTSRGHDSRGCFKMSPALIPGRGKPPFEMLSNLKS
jgi:hypothetical protein